MAPSLLAPRSFRSVGTQLVHLTYLLTVSSGTSLLGSQTALAALGSELVSVLARGRRSDQRSECLHSGHSQADVLWRIGQGA